MRINGAFVFALTSLAIQAQTLSDHSGKTSISKGGEGISLYAESEQKIADARKRGDKAPEDIVFKYNIEKHRARFTQAVDRIFVDSNTKINVGTSDVKCVEYEENNQKLFKLEWKSTEMNRSANGDYTQILNPNWKPGAKKVHEIKAPVIDFPKLRQSVLGEGASVLDGKSGTPDTRTTAIQVRTTLSPKFMPKSAVKEIAKLRGDSKLENFVALDYEADLGRDGEIRTAKYFAAGDRLGGEKLQATIPAQTIRDFCEGLIGLYSDNNIPIPEGPFYVKAVSVRPSSNSQVLLTLP